MSIVSLQSVCKDFAHQVVFDGQRTVIEEMHAGLDEVARMREQLHVLAVRMGELGGDELKRLLAYHENRSFFGK